MPTENNEVIPGKVFVQTNENEEPIELQCCKIEADTMDYKADEMKYAEKTMPNGISFEIKMTRKILKSMGLETITRKRFKKLLMGCEIQRNEAEIIANEFCKNKIQYTPLAVQKVVETIMIEVEKREKE